jgi:hypothetical protein
MGVNSGKSGSSSCHNSSSTCSSGCDSSRTNSNRKKTSVCGGSDKIWEKDTSGGSTKASYEVNTTILGCTAAN